ncbi:MAG TPA: DUF998 domain-containing protein [Jiangellaceae bacterium]|nr:DUF998 domain-containing protein [Jiangellaceae bacterium]
MTAATAPADLPVTRTSRATSALLACGVVAGPLFVAAAVIQAATRDGFDPARHALSQLSLGELGWIQITNFIVTGLLVVASAIGMRRVLTSGRGAIWAPRLIGTYGVALIWGGVFVADPAYGFPVGTPDAAPEELSWHGILHGFAPAVAGLALVIACIVFVRRFAAEGRRGWLIYSVVAAVVYVVLGFASFPAEDFRLMLAGGAVIWTWASAVTARLSADAR